MADPMLPIICGHHCESDESRAVYDEIDAEDPSTHYSPSQDFPYLGRRLEILQAYVKNHRPKSFWALWHDDRDVGFWWTFWVCFIGNSKACPVIITAPRL